MHISLGETDLKGIDLSQTDLRWANLWESNLSRANLRGSDLSGAYLRGINLSGANLSDTNLSMSYLGGANLNLARLDETDFSSTTLGQTVFGDVDLRRAKGLETIRHVAPSTIGIDTIVSSQGNISEVFLRRTGVPDVFILYARSLITQPINYCTCFISYSNKDEAFAERLYNDLQMKGVRCWFAPHDIKIGDKIRPSIDESIRFHDKLLLILSQHSVCSQWVEHEVETAIGKELESKPNVLFPIRLDDAVMESKTGWASHILTRYVGDFTNCNNYNSYQKSFNRLLRDLKVESKKTYE